LFYSNGRVYYTLAGKTQMFWRWFEPDSGVMGADEFTLSDGHNWSHVAGAFLSGNTLYYADSLTKSLFQIPFTNGQPTGTATLADASIDWTSRGAFVAQGNSPPPPQPPNASFTVNCTGLSCSFNASASTDPSGTITSYAWNFGDGQTETDPGSTTTHSYAAPGSDSVQLTVTDSGDGLSGSATQTATPSSGGGGGTNPISFVGANAHDGNATSETVTVPAASQVGDALLLFDSYASTSATTTVPAGWTQVGTSTSHNGLITAVYERTVQAGDPGSSVKVSYSATVKAAVTVADYASASGTVEMEASNVDTSTASHVSPTLNGLSNGSFAVTFWTDKSTGTTAWTPPSGVTKEADVYGSGGGAVSSLVADSGGSVSGTYGGLTATTNATSGSGAEWTIGLAGS
ncbi:MAG TPA: PKD domain-containing protein, partial [Mycobacteriales bacterium]|nr:PKD domain-containing protein [Mycobacteriales bacterium]